MRRLLPMVVLASAAVAIGCSNGSQAVEPSADRQAIVVAAARWVIEQPMASIPGRAVGAVDIPDHFASGSFLAAAPGGVALTDAERQAVETALAPLPVRWIRELDTTYAAGTTTIPRAAAGPTEGPTRAPAHVTLLLAVPHLDGDHATVRHAIWCGMNCHQGSTIELSRGPNGEWAVDRGGAGFIS